MLISEGRALHQLHGALKDFYQGVESKKYIAGGEQSRQGIGSAARTAFGGFGIDQALAQIHDFFLAMMLEPAETRSPTRTAISHSGPSCTSTRDPDLIRP